MDEYLKIALSHDSNALFLIDVKSMEKCGFALIRRSVGREWEKSGWSFSYVSIIGFWMLSLGFEELFISKTLERMRRSYIFSN